MDFSTTSAALNQAPAIELYRLRTAIDRVLDQPGWRDPARARLHPGQRAAHSDPQAYRPHPGQMLPSRHKQAVVGDLTCSKDWLASCAARNVDAADIDTCDQPAQGRGCPRVAAGDVVGGVDCPPSQGSGRLKDKTVPLLDGLQPWRVADALQHRVVDASARSGEILESTGIANREPRP